jgi:beta-1,4-mannosyltransferase
MAKFIQRIRGNPKTEKAMVFYVAVFPSMGPLAESINPALHMFYKALDPYGVRILNNAGFSIKYFSENRDKIDAVHIHWLFNFIKKGNLWVELKGLARFIIILIHLKMSRIKIVHTVHNFPPYHEDHAMIGYLYAISLINLADLVICHSDTARRELSHFTLKRQKLRVMPHGSYTGYYRNDIGKDSARRTLGIPQDAFVYLFFGLIREYKGVDELIEAFLRLHDDKSLLYIAGDSLHNGYVENHIIPRIAKSPNIRLVNSYITDNDVHLYFNACDALVYPFRRITSSGSMMLAYTFAKPVVIRDCGLAREAFDEDAAVYFSDPGGLTKALEKVRDLDPVKARDILRKKDKDLAWSEVVKRIARKYTD